MTESPIISTHPPTFGRQVQTRMLDAAMTWFLTVNPATELFSAALSSDAFAHGLVPSPAQIIHATVGRLCSRTVSCVVTAWFAPQQFPYPWSDRADCLNSEGKPFEHVDNTSSSSSSSVSYFHHFRYMSTLFYFTNDNLVQHMFNRLITTKFVNWFSDFVDAKLFRTIRRLMRASLLAVDRYFGVDHLPAYTYEQKSSELNRQQVDESSFSSVEAMEQLEESEKQAEKEFNQHVFETLGDVAVTEGPLRGVLYRNAIPMLTYFLQTQVMWTIMSGMSKFKFMRKLLVGRFFHASAVVPYSQLWKMHLSETLVNLVEVGMSLTARAVGAIIGFYSTSLATSRSECVSSYISVADGALVGEQFLGYYLTKKFRSYASFYVHHNINEFLSEKFPLNQEVFEKEMEDLKDVHGGLSSSDDDDDEEDKTENETEKEENQNQNQNQNANVDNDDQPHQNKKNKQKKQPKDIGEDEFDEVSRQAIFTSENYYEHLGIEKSASQEEIRKAFRRQAIVYHPDRLASKTPQEQEAGTQKFKKVQQSYEVLSNEKRRKEYDFAQSQGLFESPEVASARQHQQQQRRRGGASGGPPNPFAAFFGSSSSSSKRRGEKKRNAYGEEEEDFESDQQDDDDDFDAYEQYEYQNHRPTHGVHPALVVNKYFEFIDSVVGEDNLKAQQVAYGLSSATAFGMMFVVMHQHAANQYQEFLKPGV